MLVDYVNYAKFKADLADGAMIMLQSLYARFAFTMIICFLLRQHMGVLVRTARFEYANLILAFGPAKCYVLD